jgi:hypothetical protein
MSIKCLYIQGENAMDIEPLRQKLENTMSDSFTLLYLQLTLFEKQIKIVTDEKPDLLILDFRLADNNNGVSHREPTLARDIRLWINEQILSAFPIVLWLSSNPLQNAYDWEGISHDVLDRVYVKDTDFSSHSERVMGQELHALIKGNQQIASQEGQFYKMLGFLEESEADWMHPHTGEPLLNQNGSPVHEDAQYILTELIDRQGPLISEPVLAARLGVDIQKSPDWEKLKEILSGTCVYSGVFNKVWPRWWSSNVEQWWQAQPNSPNSWHRLKAKERVAFLRSTTGLSHLEPATPPIEAGYNERYWTLCQGFSQPIDFVDGFIVSSPNYSSGKNCLTFLSRLP